MKNSVTKITKYLTRKYPVRLHMSLILLTVTLSGALLAKMLYLMGFESMAMRYALSVLLAYLVLLALVRIWLWYISPSRRLFDMTSIDGVSGNGGGSSAETPSLLKGEGGSFGGGGSSASFGEARGAGVPSANLNSNISPASMNTGATNAAPGNISSSGGGGRFSIGSIDIGDAGEGILIILLILVVLSVTGAWVYLILQAPGILGEAAFEFGLGGSLFRKVHKIHTGNWAGSIIRSTIIPAVVILILAGAFGYASDHICPGRHKLVPVIKECIMAEK